MKKVSKKQAMEWGKKFEALKKTRPLNEEWKPKIGDTVYHIYTSNVEGCAVPFVLTNCEFDKEFLRSGNYFRTLKAAKHAFKEVKKLLKSLPRG